MTQTTEPSYGRLILFMALFVLAGLPLVAYLWETLNELLALHVRPDRLINSIPLLVLFGGLLVFLAGRLRRIMPSSK